MVNSLTKILIGSPKNEIIERINQNDMVIVNESTMNITKKKGYTGNKYWTILKLLP